MQKDITNRADVFLLVDTFYKRIRKDAVLGPIFDRNIKDWDAHLVVLTDFWETQIFLVRKYNDNPLIKHVEVDVKEGHTINEKHFGIWINHWVQTVDSLFEGDKAFTAKNRARKMASFIHINMFNARKGTE